MQRTGKKGALPISPVSVLLIAYLSVFKEHRNKCVSCEKPLIIPCTNLFASINFAFLFNLAFMYSACNVGICHDVGLVNTWNLVLCVQNKIAIRYFCPKCYYQSRCHRQPRVLFASSIRTYTTCGLANAQRGKEVEESKQVWNPNFLFDTLVFWGFPTLLLCAAPTFPLDFLTMDSHFPFHMPHNPISSYPSFSHVSSTPVFSCRAHPRC